MNPLHAILLSLSLTLIHTLPIYLNSQKSNSHPPTHIFTLPPSCLSSSCLLKASHSIRSLRCTHLHTTTYPSPTRITASCRNVPPRHPRFAASPYAHLRALQTTSFNSIMRLHIAATHAVSQDASVNIQLSNKRTSSCTRNRGRGVIVYIIDTGCRATHEQLAHTYPHLKVSPTAPFANASDDNGHGTHVAATIAGRDFGLAPEVRLVCIKALSSQNEGRARDVASAIRHVLRTHPRDVPGILSISLGARAPKGYTKLDEMINKAASVGLIPVIAAGNSGISACTYTPARADQAVTVGAATRGGRLAGFSNWGACVGVLAPGVRIWSAWGGGDGLYARASGTSMAAPYVAGLVALALGDGLVSGVVGVKRMLREVSGGAVVSGDAFCEWVERQRRERVSKWGWVRG